MKFDRRIVETCLHPDECLSGNSDFRCADPAFAAAHPELCGPVGTQRRLLIKPDISTLCYLENVQYRTFLITDGEEVEITSGLSYNSSNPGVAIIGVTGGKATAVGAGLATISVAWQDLSAFAQLVGLGCECCDQQKVGMMLLVDNSRSMSQAFSATFATRLSFGREQAHDFAGDLNTTKDVMGVISFNEVAFLAQGLTSDVAALQGAVDSIPPTTALTSLDEGLELALATLAGDLSLDRRVVVVVSDGFDHGPDPLPRAAAFTDAGGIIVVLGTRAAGSAYILLGALASGGMFINATPENQESVNDWFRGTKGYFCAGNCAPPGDTIAYYPELTYSGFANWDVTGTVDLIGGTPPYEWFDLLPGNGLYVDLSGSGAPWLGKLTTQATYALVAGQQYRVTVELAGNQRTSAPGFQVRVQLGSQLSQTVTLDDWQQGFTSYSWTLVAVDDPAARLSVEQLTSGALAYGNLLNLVKLENLTTATTLLSDNFDTENPTYIPPACGTAQVPEEYGGGYAYGYSCYGFGCLTSPIPAQGPDPNPQEDLEGASL